MRDLFLQYFSFDKLLLQEGGDTREVLSFSDKGVEVLALVPLEAERPREDFAWVKIVGSWCVLEVDTVGARVDVSVDGEIEAKAFPLLLLLGDTVGGGKCC